MQTLSFILALAFMTVWPALTGNLDSGRPGIGTFAYSGSPIVTLVPEALVVAAR